MAGSKTRTVTDVAYGVPPTANTTYEIDYVSPSPSVLAPPQRTPGDVASCLQEAARLYWIDIGASANKLRMSIESILDEQAIRTQDKTLGVRLANWNPAPGSEMGKVKSSMLAIKLVGNSGSHRDMMGLDRDDILDGFEVVEGILQLLYPPLVDRHAEAAARLTAKHTPAKREP